MLSKAFTYFMCTITINFRSVIWEHLFPKCTNSFFCEFFIRTQLLGLFAFRIKPAKISLQSLAVVNFVFGCMLHLDFTFFIYHIYTFQYSI